MLSLQLDAISLSGNWGPRILDSLRPALLLAKFFLWNSQKLATEQTLAAFLCNPQNFLISEAEARHDSLYHSPGFSHDFMVQVLKPSFTKKHSYKPRWGLQKLYVLATHEAEAAGSTWAQVSWGWEWVKDCHWNQPWATEQWPCKIKECWKTPETLGLKWSA